MKKYYLDMVYLNDCPYSEAAHNLLQDKNIEHNLIRVSRDNKEQYKTELIKTFPQIYLKKNNNKLLIGGYDKLNDIYNIFTNVNINLDNKIKEVNNIDKNLSKKAIIRLYENLIK